MPPMVQSQLSPILTGLGGLGFFLLWVVMILNGTFGAVWAAATTGVFADGRPLQTVYTGIFPIDFLISILMAFFDPLTSLVDIAPYLILFELIISIHVFNILALVEGCRAERSSWLRFPALWQVIYNCIGVAVGFPFFARAYVEQGTEKNAKSLSRAEAQALPFTAVWNWLIPILMFLPAWTSLPVVEAQKIVALWFLSPALLPCFQLLASKAFSSMPTRRITKPVSVAYIITGAVSGLLHLVVVFSVVFSESPGLSFGRLYIPRFVAVQRGRPDTLIEGAHLFIQLDFWMTILLVLILGTYTIREPVPGARARVRAGESAWGLVVVTGFFGPGAGMAYASYIKERRVESAVAWSKRH
ncbi:hypothetical protein GGR56DRAFT_462563 [Xylariaceae sp. FL0804]|nr:hypothetical protein GGR56DRAFT_462563 [Xylariaceae sp. FL0804]